VKSSIWREDAKIGTGSVMEEGNTTDMRATSTLLLGLVRRHARSHKAAAIRANLGGTVGIRCLRASSLTWGKNTFTFGGQLAFPLGRLPFQGGFVRLWHHGQSLATVPVSDLVLTATEGSLAVRAKTISYHPLLRFSRSER
jgi:hypothetical protein